MHLSMLTMEGGNIGMAGGQLNVEETKKTGY